MAREPEKPVSPAPISPDRLWAEQLAMGLALLVGILIFMACFHAPMLSAGVKVLGPDYLPVYGWSAALGIILQLVVHEVATLVAAWRMKLPLHFRFFPFGANATAILEYLPRQSSRDATVGFAGPLTGAIVSVVLAVIYHVTYDPEKLHSIAPLLLGMACVGYFYNLFTLIPILDLEGGWIAPAIAPQAWLLGLVACVLELTHGFNLLLLGVVCFGMPRLILLIQSRASRTDQDGTPRHRLLVNLGYFVLVLALAWLGTATFDQLARVIPEAMSD